MRYGWRMVIVTPVGYTLTSSGEFVPGGPACRMLGAGLRMDSLGRVWSAFPSINSDQKAQ